MQGNSLDSKWVKIHRSFALDLFSSSCLSSQSQLSIRCIHQTRRNNVGGSNSNTAIEWDSSWELMASCPSRYFLSPSLLQLSCDKQVEEETWEKSEQFVSALLALSMNRGTTEDDRQIPDAAACHCAESNSRKTNERDRAWWVSHGVGDGGQRETMVVFNGISFDFLPVWSVKLLNIIAPRRYERLKRIFFLTSQPTSNAIVISKTTSLGQATTKCFFFKCWIERERLFLANLCFSSVLNRTNVVRHSSWITSRFHTAEH